GLNLTEAQKSLILEILLDPTGQRTLIDSQNRYRAALAAYKRELVGPVVERAAKVFADHGLLAPEQLQPMSLASILKLVSERRQQGLATPVTGLKLLVGSREEVEKAWQQVQAMGLDLAGNGMLSFAVKKEDIIVDRLLLGQLDASTDAQGYLALVRFDPASSLSVEGMVGKLNEQLYFSLNPEDNYEGFELDQWGFCSLVVGAQGRPGFIDDREAVYARTRRVFDLSRTDLLNDHILVRAVRQLVPSKTGRDAIKALEALHSLILQARTEALSQKKEGESELQCLSRCFDAVLKRLLDARSDRAIMAKVLEETMERTSRQVCLFDGRFAENSAMRTVLENLRADGSRISGALEDNAALLAFGFSSEEIARYRDRITAVQRDAFNYLIMSDKTYDGAKYLDIIRNAFYRTWNDPVKSPRMRLVSLTRLLNELNAYDDSRILDEELFSLEEAEIAERVLRYLNRKAGASASGPALSELRREAFRIADSIYSMLFHVKLVALSSIAPEVQVTGPLAAVEFMRSRPKQNFVQEDFGARVEAGLRSQTISSGRTLFDVHSKVQELDRRR
ncbi:MAG: hypothetical protein WC490_00440, partial [Candidatus Margulisiibacteriota bacterium]